MPNFRIVQPNGTPLVRVCHFSDQPSFHEAWKAGINPGSTLLSDRYWVFAGDSEAGGAHSVGIAIRGIISYYHELEFVRLWPQESMRTTKFRKM